MNKKILVVMGGMSSEREVSLVSGKNVSEALQKIGYDVFEYDLKSGVDFLKTLEREKPDVVFNALHGTIGEDGTIQGFLDLLQIPYTHSGVKSSAIGMDKNLCKIIAQNIGIKTAKSEKMSFKEFKTNGTKIDFPYVVKPVDDGSSVGIFIIKKDEDIKNVFYSNDDKQILIEKFIAGMELTCMVLDDKTFVVTELVASNEFYDYQAKYTNGFTKHILPAPIPEDITKEIRQSSLKIHQAIGCNTISRSDFRYNPTDGAIFLEINTNPGLTPLSLAPEQAKYAGICYEELCKILVENATCKKI